VGLPRCAQTCCALLLPVLAAVVPGLACDTSPTEPNTSAWQAEIRPVTGISMISGSLGAVTDRQLRRTETSISITGAAPSSTLGWRIRAGRCEGERGGVVGAPVSYTALETGDSGSASVTVTLTQALASTVSYMVEIWRGPSDDALVACGALQRI
jgi:hypothetical protein